MTDMLPLKECLKNYEGVCPMPFILQLVLRASGRDAEQVLTLSPRRSRAARRAPFHAAPERAVLFQIVRATGARASCFPSELLPAVVGVLCHSSWVTGSSCWILIEAPFSSFYFQVFVSAVLRWWPFTFRPLGVQYRGSPSARVAFSQHHTFRKPGCSMKAASERPFSPVFCLHGPLEVNPRGDFWKPEPLTSAWQGETRLIPHRLVNL